MATRSFQITVKSAALVEDKKFLKAVMRTAGREIADQARALIRSSAGGGKAYRGKNRGKTASLPGNAPRSLSGRLAASIKIKPFRNGEGVVISDEANFGGVFYARMLEVGAAHPSKIGKRRHRARAGTPSGGLRTAARPFLSTALQLRIGSLAPRIQTALNKSIKLVAEKV